MQIRGPNGWSIPRQNYFQQVAEKRCCPWFDKLTMRSKPVISLGLILSLSQDGAELTMRSKPLVSLSLILSLSQDGAELTMRSKPLVSLGLILSLSKDGARI